MLYKVGGPEFRSLTAACASALVRTSYKTLPSWKQWISQLSVAATTHLPLLPLVKDILTPTFWDSPPLVVNLREAFLGFPTHPHFNFSESDLIGKLRSTQRVEPRAQHFFRTFPRIYQTSVGAHGSILRELSPACVSRSTDLCKVPVQKLVYKHLISIRHKDNIIETIERRLTKLFLPFTLDFSSSISLVTSLGVLKGNRPADVLKVLKSWCNGWATSNRYHEDVRLPCLFGCNNCKDDMQHYLQCPHLFALHKFMIPYASEDPLMRWCINSACKDSIQQVACIHCGYHAVRRYYKASHACFTNNMTNIGGAFLRTSWTVFADAFQAEASELKISTFKFSVPSFFNFLNNGIHPSSLCNGTFEVGEQLPVPSELQSLH